MKNHRVRVCAVLAVLAGATSVIAKGVTTRIEMIGGQLSKPISIADTRMLDAFNVWSGPGTSMNGVEGTTGFIID